MSRTLAPKHKRALWVVGLWLCAAAGLFVVLQQFEKNLLYFYSPSDLATSPPAQGRMLRMGGLVEAGSVTKQGLQHIQFAVTDGAERVQVDYEGLLPALFREGQGVVMEGIWQNNAFVAEKILTKHDENYMPPEVARSLKEQGTWRGNAPPAPTMPAITP